MVLQYCSDLHLEFRHNKEFLTTNPLQPKGDVLLLAGDIVPFAIMEKHADFFSYVSDHFQTTYWIPGNHEYYYIDVADRCGTLNEKIRSNIFLVNNTVVQHQDLRFVFSTLWSKIGPPNELQIERGMSDFQVIKYKGNRFSAAEFNLLHQECLDFLTKELTPEKTSKSVVVTHHVPTFLNYPEKYKDDVLNEAFAAELFDLIVTAGPDLWIYGHHHSNVPDLDIGNTRLMTNQLGYVKCDEHQSFRLDKVVSIENQYSKPAFAL